MNGIPAKDINLYNKYIYLISCPGFLPFSKSIPLLDRQSHGEMRLPNIQATPNFSINLSAPVRCCRFAKPLPIAKDDKHYKDCLLSDLFMLKTKQFERNIDIK